MAQLQGVTLTEEQALRTSVVIGSEAARPDLGFLVENRNRMPSLEELQVLSPQTPLNTLPVQLEPKALLEQCLPLAHRPARLVAKECSSSRGGWQTS